MAMVKIKSGKTVKAGSRSKGGGYEYEVQADGSIKNLTTGRTTSPATGKASKVQKAMPAAKAAATSKALTRSTAEKTAPIPKTRPVKMTSAAARPEGPASGMPKAKTPITVGGRGSGLNPKPVTAGGRGSGMNPKPITAGGRGSGTVTPITTGGRISSPSRATPNMAGRSGGLPVFNMSASSPMDAIQTITGARRTAKITTPDDGTVRPAGFSKKRYKGPFQK